MGSILPELSLDVRPTFIPKSIGDFLVELTTVGSNSDKIYKIDDFVRRLEEEMRKIEAFKRELPLCVLITNDAISVLKDELKKYRKRNAEPILEEFIPLKKNSVDEEKIEYKNENDSRDKMNWMSSAQLWNDDDSKNSDSDFIKGKGDWLGASENRGFPGVISPFESSRGLPAAGLPLFSPRFPDINSRTNSTKVISSSTLNCRSNFKGMPQPQIGRKQRRCWSPELHQLFVDALEKLGGSQVATPKQIRDLMRVDGLTNDEVKSHLQKYRLHTRRVPTSKPNSSDQAPLDFGGSWPQMNRCGESLKQSSSASQSGSPTSPLQLSKNGGSIDEEEDDDDDDDDEGSESYGWKNRVRKSGNKGSL